MLCPPKYFLRFYFSVLFVFLTCAVFVNIVSAQSVRSANTEVELISEFTTVQENSVLRVALKMVMDPEWHVYWKNPGDSGLAPTIKWLLPQGITAEEIQWPVPEKIEVAGLTSYGYSHEVYLISDIFVPSNARLLNGELLIAADVQWLACKIQCVGGTAKIQTSVKVAHDSVKSVGWKTVERFLENTTDIVSLPGELEIRENQKSFIIRVPRSNFLKNQTIESMYVFPEREDLIDHASQQILTKDKGNLSLNILKSSLILNSPEKIAGLLMVNFKDGARKAYVFDAPVRMQTTDVESEISSLWLAVVFAFLGGLILNLMPCVLPVLSIKILHLVEHHNQGRGQVLKHAGVFSLGVIFTFWVLALGLYVFKLFGTSLGWGFQFQSPIFLIILSMLFFWLALNLFGLFEMGVGLTQISLGGAEKTKQSYKGSFFSGILTAVVATPCTAPFMGSALGYALVRPAGYSLVVFTALGLGMVFPYLMLSQFPKLLRFIPKPGQWMIRLKKFFGFLFVATALWLVWVLYIQKGFQAGIGILISWIILLNAGWILRKYAGLSASFKQKQLAWGVIGLSILIAFFTAVVFSYSKKFITDPENLFSKNSPAIFWQEYSPELLNRMLDEGRAVFIDFTAEWCLSCKANEKIALNSKKVADRFKELGVIAIKVDLTDYNKLTTEALESYGKKSIPVYVFYAQGKHSDPIFLPEILTPGIVLKYLDGIELQK